jgi:PAS domain S-box-containing protein
VDDDKNYFTLIQKMLARDSQGYTLDWVASYAMARAVAEKARHDIYLIDYKLTDQDGLQLMHDLQTMGIDAPIIILTALSDDDFDLRALEAGATDFLHKTDLKASVLIRAIRHALQRAGDMRALRRSEENYRLLLEDASDGIFILNPDGIIVLANSTACAMVALPCEQVEGEAFAGFVGPARRGDSPFDVAALAPGVAQIREYVLKRRDDGASLPVEISAKIVSNGDIQCSARDITHRKNAESERERFIQRLTILRQIDDELNHMLNIEYVLSLTLDAAVRLSAANAGFIATLEGGVVRKVQAIGQYARIQPGDALPRVGPFRRVIETEQAQFLPSVAEERDYLPSIPETRAQMLFPLMSYERILGVLNLETNRDDRFNEDTFEFIKLIATRAAVAIENAQLYQIAQDQLARTQELYVQVSELEKLKTDMIRIAAHDLRNPVGIIVGYLELLDWSLAGKITDKQKAQLEAMSRAAQRMERITTDILSLEKIEKLHLGKNDFIGLNAVVSEVFEEYAGQAADKSQRFTLRMTDEQLSVRADTAQLREAMANLVGNAIKYTPNNGMVSVSLVRERGFAIFNVIDTGYGIPADQQARLFQPFFRADSDETKDIDGTGLGLHLVKNIIIRHEGQMIFESVYGQGSTFGFRLPLSD